VQIAERRAFAGLDDGVPAETVNSLQIRVSSPAIPQASPRSRARRY
jgi:hypothetical protein